MKSRNKFAAAAMFASLTAWFASPAGAISEVVASRPTEAEIKDPASDRPESARAQFTRAASLFEAQEPQAADAVLRRLLEDPQFQAEGDAFKAAAYSLAAGVALVLEDMDRAWPLLNAANSSPAAFVDVAAATVDLAVEVWQPEKAIVAMQVLAARAPEKLRALDDRTVFRMNYTLQQQNLPDAERVAFLQAFFDADRMQQDGRQPSQLWLELARLQLARANLAAATRVAGRITSARAVLALQVDRRFDEIVAALDPAQLDISAALARDVETITATIARNPRDLQNVVELTYALMEAGRFADALAACDAALKRSADTSEDAPAFDDEADALVWIHDNRARALLGLGRVDDSVVVWEAARRMAEDGGANVSQAINVGLLHAALGQQQDALDALSAITEASPYGWMQFHATRIAALLGSTNDPRAGESLAYVREHRADATATHVQVLLMSGAMDEASVAFRERLADADHRADALLDAQRCIEHPVSPLHATWLAQMRELVARPEVAAAIDSVGRVKQVPLHVSLL